MATGIPAPVVRQGFCLVRTPDVERMVHYYEDALDFVVTQRDATTTYLTTSSDHHCVVVEKGERDGRAALGFYVGDDLSSIQQHLETVGVEVELRHDPQPGVSAALVVAEHESGTPLHLFERQEVSGVPAVAGVRPTKLGHVASFVQDLEGSQSFYTDLLGFRWSDMVGDFFTFLRCNTDHHAINLLRTPDRRGLFHIAYEMRDVNHLKDALDHLARREIRLEWGVGRHGAGHNIFSYHRDPDGNVIELFTELDIIADEVTGQFVPRPWHESFPQTPKVWDPGVTSSNVWGPLSPESLTR